MQNCSFESFLDPSENFFPYTGKRFEAESCSFENLLEIFSSILASDLRLQIALLRAFWDPIENFFPYTGKRCKAEKGGSVS